MEKIKVFSVFSLLFLALISQGQGQQLNFTNPIFDGKSADPCILKVGPNYYLTLSENNERELTIFKSPILTSFRNAEKKIAYTAPEGFRDLWASEMHLVDGELYIYFCMGEEGAGHAMYVVKADNASNPMGSWGQPQIMMDNEWAIDGTIMRHNGQKYFVYVHGLPTGLGIMIAPMINATHVNGTGIILREPKFDWECTDGCVDEGPYFIYNRNVTYMVFSGSNTWDPGYSLSWMSIPEGRDPMNLTNWYSAPGPVFWKNEEEDVYQTGHAAFTVSPDEKETWMVYHGTEWDHRDIRIARVEKIEWDEETGIPLFPRPHGFNHSQPVPSGQTSV